jgi:hypothetical protein
VKNKNYELWRTLRVGDRVRLTEIPPEFLQEGYVIFPETMRVYKKLLARRRSLRVFEIDEYGAPWIKCRFRRKNGTWEWHWLAIDHDGIARVSKKHSARKRLHK